MNDLPLTTQQAAEFLGVSYWTLVRWRRTGDGPAWVKLGRKRVAYRQIALAQYLERQSNGGAS